MAVTIWARFTLEICEVALLVEAGLVQTERVDDIDLLLGRILDTLLSLLGRGIATSVCDALGLGERKGCAGTHRSSRLQR